MIIIFEKLKLIEYDIRSANASVMIASNIIDKNFYEKLMSMEKKERVITVGKMMRDDSSLHDRLMEEYRHYTDRFIKENEMEDNVYQVVKDAVWVYNKMPKKTQFGNYVKFTKDRVATSVLTLKNIKFYYNSIEGKLFNRGLGDIDEEEFKLMDKIKEFMMLKESNSYKALYERIHKFHLDYITGDIEDAYRYNIRRKNKEIYNDDPTDDLNYTLIKLMIEYLL